MSNTIADGNTDPEYLKELASNINDSVASFITEKQLTAYLLYETRDVTYKQVADEMGLAIPTVQQHKQTAEEKIVGAYVLKDVFEENPWWIQPAIEDE